MKQASDVEEILTNEVTNNKYIYLYLEEGIWCAYERSAYYLTTMDFPVKLDIEIVQEGYDVILIKSSFPVERMRLPLFPSSTLKTVADNRLIFKIETTIYGFIEWKEEQLKRLRNQSNIR